MKHIESDFEAEDGIRLFTQYWRPEKEPVSAVCLIHGLGEHSSRYAHMAEYFVEEGHAFFAFDLRGHGRSGGPRGHLPSFDLLMSDVRISLEKTHQTFPETPVFLYGHSLGGILVLNAGLRYKPAVRGIIATASGLRTALEKQVMKVQLARIGGLLLPRISLPSGLEQEALSRDPQVVRAYKLDPLVHDRVSFGFARELLKAISWTFEHASEFPSIPLLMMHGAKDRLAYPRGSQEFCAAVLECCELKMWPDLYHELHNEPERNQVFDYVLNWINEKVEES